MTLLWTIAIGVVIGLIARLLNRGADSIGLILSALVATVGALGATYGGHLCGMFRPGQPAGFVAALVGAVVIVLLVRMSQPESAE